jgi:hypothetical protein
MDLEMASLTEHNIYEEVPEDSLSTWSAQRGRAGEVADVLWVLKKKYNELRELLKHKARATSRGDQGALIDQKYNRTPAETFAPTLRLNTFKTICAAGVARAAKTGRQSRFRSGDVPVAFLRGSRPESCTRYLRPPPGYRSFDRRGVPIVWKLKGNLYGESSAPRVWHETALAYCLSDELAFKQSDADPCYLYKVYPNGTRLDLGLFVDDTWIWDDADELADADLAKLIKRFDLKLVDQPKQFLGMNVEVQSPTRIKLTMEAYVLQMADTYVPDWRSWGTVKLPCTDKLLSEYEKAHAREEPLDAKVVERFRGKVGALIYATPTIRVDACTAVGRLSRGQTFATPGLERCADETIVYLAQTASLGLTFDGTVTDACVAHAQSDSDWAVGHSTTGWAIWLAGSVIAFASKRQTCIATSSTEAELVAASTCSLEMVFVRVLLRELGLEQDSTLLEVDNNGAVALARDRRSCHRSRHIDRRYFKVRELAALKVLHVQHVPTADNAADLLTKPLDEETFLKHRRTLMNLPST